jgi:hypothetical protein
MPSYYREPLDVPLEVEVVLELDELVPVDVFDGALEDDVVPLDFEALAAAFAAAAEAAASDATFAAAAACASAIACASASALAICAATIAAW